MPFRLRFLLMSLIPLTTATHSRAAGAGEDSVTSDPLAISAAIDFGQIIQGRRIDPAVSFDGQFLQRTGVWLTQRASVQGRLDLTMGVGGMFWYALPEETALPASLVTRFGPGISQAFGVYKFGDLESPAATLQMGYFPYKYNPEATNLGEYLLRSGTYPGSLMTGGWNIISSAAYMMQGFRLTVPLWEGRFRSDFILPMERDLPPMYSISPTYMATLKLFPGLELGGGVVWNHGIPIRPSKETPKTSANWFITKRERNPDTTAREYWVYTYDTTKFYTFQGIKAGGRVSLDPKAWFGETSLGPQDLKLYGEVAVLGWKNYPFFYEKRSERMPIMAGFNFPTFGLLDVLSIEVQHYKSSFQNSIYQAYFNQVPTWTLDDPGTLALAMNKTPGEVAAELQKLVDEDNIKWSVYAKRELYRGLRVYAQLASDHMRPTDINQNPFWVPVTNRNGKDWYYLMRLEFGI